MTRKRFIKLLMSLDYNRNEANEMAEAVRQAGHTYAGVWENEKTAYRGRLFMYGVLEGLRDSCNKLAQSIMDKLAPALAKVAETAKKVTAQLQPENPHLDGLRADVVLVDEWDGLPSDKLHDMAVQAAAGGGGHD